MKLLGFNPKRLERLLYLGGNYSARFNLVELLVEDFFHRFAKINGLAKVECQFGVESKIIRRVIWKHVAHSFMPNRKNDGNARRISFKDDSPDAPFQSHMFFFHVDLAFGKYMHPVAHFQLLYAKVNGWLIDAGASHHWDTFAEHEEQ